MAQHDYDLANQAGAAFRSDLNNALSAIVTWNSGASDPATTFARMRAVNTTSGVVKRRNAANSAWLIESTDDETRVIDRSSNTILDVSDIGKTFRATSTFTQTLDAASTLTDGWWVGYRVEADVVLTVDPNSSENIDGATTKVIAGPASGIIVCNGSAFYTVGFPPEHMSLNNQSAAYTTVMADSRRPIRHPSTDNNPRTFTIDSNANVPYKIGTLLTFFNEINTLTVAITSDTMTLLGSGATGSRTITGSGMLNAYKVTSTTWLCWGVNVA